MADQNTLTDYVEEPDALFGDVRDYVGDIYGTIRNRASTFGLDLDWLSDQPRDAEIDDSEDIWVFQYVVAYSKGSLAQGYAWGDDKAPVRDGSPSPEVQFKVGIYVVGEPTDDLKNRIRQIDNPRLVTLFNTDVYQGYMDGFGFEEKKEYEQNERVSAREVEQKGYGLGVPWFEVEAYDEDGSLEGYADGYLNPFSRDVVERVTERGAEPPQREIWQFSGRQSRGNGQYRYRVKPQGNTGAKERAKKIAGKDAYLNGHYVGSILSGGRFQLRVEYDNPNLASRASRKQIIESGTPYQALSEGANVYKVREESDKVIFSTTKPADWEADDPDQIDPDAVGVERQVEQVTEILIDEDEPTQFTVETDENDGRLLGIYSPIVVRDIERETDLLR